jgi:MFS family permease
MKNKLLVLAACLVAFFSTVGAALPYPILPPLFAADAANDFNHFLGLPPKLLFGLALTINPLGLLIGSALLGPLSDRYGRRPIILGTSVGAALGHAVTAVALLAQSYPLFIVARFVTGLMEGHGSVARALLAERLQGDLRVRALAWLNGAFYMGWLAGPLLAGVTLVWGQTAPFWVATAAMLGTAAIAMLAVPRQLAADAGTAADAAPSWWQVARHRHALTLLTQPELRTLFIVQLALTCGVTAFYEFYPLWLVEVTHFDAQGIAWATAGLCGTMTLASLLAGRPSRLEPLQRASLFALGVAACIATVGLGGPKLGLAAIVLFGIPNAYYNAVMPAWCAERFGHQHGQGAVMGLLSTIFCLANILMAAIGAGLTLVDTSYILLLGAATTAWAAWRIQRWRQWPGMATAVAGAKS